MNCDFHPATLLIFSKNIEVPLIYYSHLSSIVIFLCLFGLTFLKLKSWPKTSFRLMTLSYVVWLFCDLVLWANPDTENVLFFWILINLVEPLIFIGAFGFFYSFISNKPLTIKTKYMLLGFLLPTLVMAVTGLSVTGFDATNCDRNVVEGIAAYYNYILEALCLISVIIFSIIFYRKKERVLSKTKIILTSTGTSFLMISFLLANFLGTLLTEYDISQYGHIAVPIFAIFLAYVTIKYESFEPRVVLTDILVAGLMTLIASLFFVDSANYQQYVTALTFILSIPVAYTLVTGIRKEVKQKKNLQELSNKLADANIKLQDVDKLKTEFLSLASHQLRSPLTAIKGYTSMLLEGSFGTITKEQTEAVDRVYQSSKHLAMVVEDLLNVSKIEQGGMKYVMDPFDIRKQAHELAMDLKVTAEKKGLVLTFVSDSELPHTVYGDMEKIRQVLLNFIDNSVKYTEKGSIEVSVKTIVKAGKNVVRFAVKDTGMGISPETKAKLFQKFSRGEGGKINTGGSGLGLYLAKEIAAAHKGMVDVESEGMGKGSTFVLEMEEYKETQK